MIVTVRRLDEELSAGSRVRNATTAPNANSTSDASTNGTAYRRSFGFSPGVMNRQSS